VTRRPTRAHHHRLDHPRRNRRWASPAPPRTRHGRERWTRHLILSAALHCRRSGCRWCSVARRRLVERRRLLPCLQAPKGAKGSEGNAKARVETPSRRSARGSFRSRSCSRVVDSLQKSTIVDGRHPGQHEVGISSRSAHGRCFGIIGGHAVAQAHGAHGDATEVSEAR